MLNYILCSLIESNFNLFVEIFHLVSDQVNEEISLFFKLQLGIFLNISISTWQFLLKLVHTLSLTLILSVKSVTKWKSYRASEFNFIKLDWLDAKITCLSV